jgi:hypothetical protein
VLLDDKAKVRCARLLDAASRLTCDFEVALFIVELQAHLGLSAAATEYGLQSSGKGLGIKGRDRVRGPRVKPARLGIEPLRYLV